MEGGPGSVRAAARLAAEPEVGKSPKSHQLLLWLVHFCASSLLGSVPPRAASWAQTPLIRLGGAGCSSHPADELAIRSSIARLHIGEICRESHPSGRSLPSPSANSGVSSLHSCRTLQETKGAFGAEAFGSGGCRCLQQGLTPPHPKRPSHPAPWSCKAAAAWLCQATGITRFPLELEKPRGLGSAQPPGAGSCEGLSTKFGAGRCRGREWVLLGAAACSSWGKGRLSCLRPSPGQAVAFPSHNVTALPRHRCLAAGHWAAAIDSIARSVAPRRAPRRALLLQGWHGSPCVPEWAQPRERLGASPELPQPLSPRRCRGHALRGEATALALPGRTSLLSRVCPSRAVNRDFNRLWVICCSNYPIVLAHPGSRNGSSWAAGPGGCVGAKAPGAPECSVSLGDSHGNCPGRCILHLSVGDAGSWMQDAGSWMLEAAWLRARAGGCFSHPGWC